MLYLSEILLQNHGLQGFAELEQMVRDRAAGGELFFQMDVRPPFPDTPESWEERLEAAFSAAGNRRS